ncbi:alpha/beta hydrolase [uncultured Chitinophaga sp.]|uniref:alpha/beta hydrolase n=1 Tax=uncultured Chitinophaga sp. TaxID=339340 RepID=UPI0025DB2027|nr:alpha/beta hydrolase [uncultured Chitinophaga sp.]
MSTATLSIEALVASGQPVDYSVDPHLTAETKAFLKPLNGGGPGLETLPPVEARKVLEGAQQAVKVDLSGIEVTEKTINTDGMDIQLFIVRPEGIKETLPVFIFVHGGGWVLGDFPTHKRLVRDLVVATGYASVFVEYSRSPEATFPVPLNEVYAATKWVAEHGSEINVDGNKLAIVGNSAGGNLSAATVLRAKAENGPAIKLQVLFWPVTNSDFQTASYKQFGAQRFLTAPVMEWMFDQYTPNKADRENIYVSPLKATTEQLKGLPPTLIQVAENDILRDEGEAYGRKLDEAGVKVTTVRYVGVIHDWGMLNGMAELDATKSLILHAAAELKKYLA